MTNRSAGAGRDGSRLRAKVEEWRVRAGKWRTRRSGRGKAEVCDDCADELDAILAVPDPLASDTGQGVAVAGRMERSIADFIRACGVHLVAQQESIMPDNALIAVLCDAIRLARESIRAAAAPLASSSAPQGETFEQMDARIKSEMREEEIEEGIRCDCGVRASVAHFCSALDHCWTGAARGNR